MTIAHEAVSTISRRDTSAQGFGRYCGSSDGFGCGKPQSFGRRRLFEHGMLLFLCFGLVTGVLVSLMCELGYLLRRHRFIAASRYLRQVLHLFSLSQSVIHDRQQANFNTQARLVTASLLERVNRVKSTPGSLSQARPTRLYPRQTS